MNELYSVVSFSVNGDSTTYIEYVPSSWVNQNEFIVSWPPEKDNRKLTNMRQKHVQPSEEWSAFNLKKIYYITENLDTAIKKTADFEQQSECSQTEDEISISNISVRPKRKVKPKSLLTDESSDEEPTFKKKTTKKNQDLPPAPETSTLDELLRRPARQESISMTTPSSNDVIDELLRRPAIPSGGRQESISMTTPSSRFQQTGSNDVIEESLRKLIQMTERNYNLLKSLDSRTKVLEQHMSDILRNDLSTSTLETNFEIPVTSIEELDELEKQLGESRCKESMIHKLSRCGGKSTQDAVGRVMEELLNDELASTMSYCGTRKEKVAFKNYSNVCTVISGSVMKIKPSTDKLMIEQCIKDYLKYSVKCLARKKK